VLLPGGGNRVFQCRRLNLKENHHGSSLDQRNQNLGIERFHQLTPTAITPSANAGEATKITAANTLTPGAIIVFPSSTGFPALNNKALVVTAATAADFDVAVDTFGQAGPMTAGMKVTAYPANAFINLCLSSFDIAAGSSSDIDVSTYCATGSILGKTTPGSITLNGYVDNTDVGFKELILAGEDNAPRVLNIQLPGTLGHLVGVISFGEMSFSVPLEGAVGFSITASQNVSIKYALGA
jgi:hypothetical protein